MNYGEMLVKWFLENKREMPWRNTSNPYGIWVSEIMLQQTKVDTVIPYYNRFMERFPTVNALAEATTEEVYQYWQGLGYYRRADNLHKGAKMIVNEFAGVFPQEPALVKAIPGIGDYTLGAVLSIAFHLPLPAVDGNVMRILSRQFLIDADIAVAKNKKIFEEKVMELMTEDPNPFNQGLMELGALICTPLNPKCEVCPVQSICKAYKEDKVGGYPVKTKKQKVVIEHYKALLIQKGDQYWIEKREAIGLLANLWGMPLIEKKEWNDTYKKQLSVENLEKVTHVFTHKKWEMEPVIIKESSLKDTTLPTALSPTGKYVTLEELDTFPIATAFKKVFEKIKHKE